MAHHSDKVVDFCRDECDNHHEERDEERSCEDVGRLIITIAHLDTGKG